MPRPNNHGFTRQKASLAGAKEAKKSQRQSQRAASREKQEAQNLKQQHLATKQSALKNERSSLKSLRAKRPAYPGAGAGENKWLQYNDEMESWNKAVARSEAKIDGLYQDIEDIRTGTYSEKTKKFEQPEIKQSKDERFIDISLPTGQTVTMPKSTVKKMTPKDWNKMFKNSSSAGVISSALFGIAAANVYGNIKQAGIMSDALMAYLGTLDDADDEEVIQ